MIFLKNKKSCPSTVESHTTSAILGNYDIILIILKRSISMLKQILPRATKISVIFAVAFFIINYIGMEKPDILYLVGKTIIATLAFILICLTLFTIINSPERKIKLGTTLPIALIIGIIFGAIFLTVQIGVITGLIIGVIATFIWELIEKNKGGRSS